MKKHIRKHQNVKMLMKEGEKGGRFVYYKCEKDFIARSDCIDLLKIHLKGILFTNDVHYESFVNGACLKKSIGNFFLLDHFIVTLKKSCTNVKVVENHFRANMIWIIIFVFIQKENL